MQQSVANEIHYDEKQIEREAECILFEAFIQ